VKTRGVATPFSVSSSHRGKRRVCRGAHEKVAQLVSRLLVRSGTINRPGGGGEGSWQWLSGQWRVNHPGVTFLLSNNNLHVSHLHYLGTIPERSRISVTRKREMELNVRIASIRFDSIRFDSIPGMHTRGVSKCKSSFPHICVTNCAARFFFLVELRNTVPENILLPSQFLVMRD
jgi:hypothetical protein